MSWFGLSLAVFLLVGFGFWFWSRPTHGLAALVALLPFERIGAFALGHHGSHLIRLSQIAAAALILSWLLRWATRRVKLKQLPFYFWSLPVFVVTAAASAALINNNRTWQNWLSTVLVVATLWVVAQSWEPKAWPLVRRWLLLSAGAVSLFGLYQIAGDIVGLPLRLTGLRPEYSSVVFSFPRLMSTALEPLYFANYLLIPLFVGLALWAGGQLKRWEKVAVTLVVISFGLTLSRGAFLAATVGLAVLLVVAWRRINLRLLGVVALGGALIILSIVGLSSARSRHNLVNGPRIFLQLLSPRALHSSSFSERLSGQRGAIQVVKRAPWFGVGPGRLSFDSPPTYLLPARFGYDLIFVNDTPLAVACEFGLFGLALLLWFIVGLFTGAIKQLRRKLDWTTLGFALAAGTVLLQSLTFYGFFLTHIWIVLGLLAGMTTKEKREA